MGNNRAKTFNLPQESTQEILCGNWAHVLRYGDFVLIAGYHYMGLNNPSWFGAVYWFKSQNKNVDAPIELCKVSDRCFVDEGHAILWALRYCDAKGES